jgi:hypothetical protein
MDPDPENKAGWILPHSKNVKWTHERLQNVAVKLNAWIDKSIESGQDFLLGKFCFESKLGFLPSYFARYCERCIDLDNAYNRAKEWQEFKISEGALFNTLNSRFASLWLSHAHNWKINSQEDTLKKLENEFGMYLKMQREKYESTKPPIEDEED